MGGAQLNVTGLLRAARCACCVRSRQGCSPGYLVLRIKRGAGMVTSSVSWMVLVAEGSVDPCIRLAWNTVQCSSCKLSSAPRRVSTQGLLWAERDLGMWTEDVEYCALAAC